MSNRQNEVGKDGPATYEVRIRGHLDQRWAARFGVPGLVHEPIGTTVLLAAIPDQAALHALLQLVRDLGLPLVSVNRIEPDPSRAG
jgi:hypothetical protein